jgi:transcriptional regulator with XRE-family HTH domain
MAGVWPADAGSDAQPARADAQTVEAAAFDAPADIARRTPRIAATNVDPAFGQRLRRLRGETSVRELAQRANCSKSHIWDLEQGNRRPTPAVARALDAALRAGDALISLLAEPTDKPGASHPPEAVTAGGRRDKLTRAAERGRPDLAVASSLAQTQRWYLRAAEQAREAEDLDMAATALSMRSQRAWGIVDAPLAVGLAEGALAVPGVHPATRSQAVQQLARGLAMLATTRGSTGCSTRPRNWRTTPWRARTAFRPGCTSTIRRERVRNAPSPTRRPAAAETPPPSSPTRSAGPARRRRATAAVDAARRAVAIAARSPHTASDLRSAARLLRTRGARRQADELDGLAG